MNSIDIQVAEYLVKVARALEGLETHPIWGHLAGAYINEITFGVDGDNLGWKIVAGDSLTSFEIVESVEDPSL